MEVKIMSNTNAASVAAALLAAKAKTQSEQKTDPGVKQADDASEEVQVDTSNLRVFFGEFPIAISLMTATGTPIGFYMGYHVTEDQEVIEFLSKEKTVKDVTGKIKLEDVPVAPSRNRNRSWQSASKFGGDPSVFSPADLLKRAVASSNTLSTSAQSNS